MIEKKSTLWNDFPNRSISLKKIAITLCIAALIIMPEEVGDSLLTVAHYAFEGFEFVLEELIQHAFHVDKTASQLYVFYILIALAVGMAIWAYRNGPALLRRAKNYLSAVYRQSKQQCTDYWQEQPLTQKILLIAVYIPLAFYLCSFWVM